MLTTFAIAILLLLQGTGLREEAAISGRILSSNGMPAPGVRVSAMAIPSDSGRADDASMASLGETDESGRFHLRGIPPGRYHVTAGLLDAPTYFPGVQSIAEARAVDVRAGATVSNIDFSLARSPGVRVSGIVTGVPAALKDVPLRLGLLPSPATVSAQPAREASLGLNRTFEFHRVPPGQYRLRVALPGAQQSAQPELAQITVTEAGIQGLQAVLPPLVIGRAAVDDGTPLPFQEAAVAAGVDAPALLQLQVRGAAVHQSVTRRDGLLWFSLSPGEYQVAPSMLSLGYYVKSMIYGTTDLEHGTLKITDEPSFEILVTLTKTPPATKSPGVTVGGRLTGLPADALSSPRWVGIRSIGQAGAPTVLRFGEGLVQPDGTFQIRAVVPGNYRLILTPPDQFTVSGTLAVEDGDIDNVELAVIRQAP